MALADRKWKRTSIHHVVLTWLRSERNSALAHRMWPKDLLSLDSLLGEPDLSNPEENRVRLRLWYMLRLRIVVELPPDIRWYLVHSLTDLEIADLHAITAKEWVTPAGESGLRAVAAWRRIPLAADPSQWEMPILFGNDRGGPFTIIEGNHRLAAYAGSGQTGIDIPVLVGLSPLSCHWHGPGQSIRGPLLLDLIWSPPTADRPA